MTWSRRSPPRPLPYVTAVSNEQGMDGAVDYEQFTTRNRMQPADVLQYPLSQRKSIFTPATVDMINAAFVLSSPPVKG